jgi:hypothetical protein
MISPFRDFPPDLYLLSVGLASVAIVFATVPGLLLRLIVLLWPKGHPRRAELMGEFYALGLHRRIVFVFEMLEAGLFDGLAARFVRLDSGREVPPPSVARHAELWQPPRKRSRTKRWLYKAALWSLVRVRKWWRVGIGALVLVALTTILLVLGSLGGQIAQVLSLPFAIIATIPFVRDELKRRRKSKDDDEG